MAKNNERAVGAEEWFVGRMRCQVLSRKRSYTKRFKIIITGLSRSEHVYIHHRVDPEWKVWQALKPARNVAFQSSRYS